MEEDSIDEIRYQTTRYRSLDLERENDVTYEFGQPIRDDDLSNYFVSISVVLRRNFVGAVYVLVAIPCHCE